MRPGSVIVDLAAPAGGNCELTKPGETTVVNGVTIFAPLNLAATVPVHASQLYSRNIVQLSATDGEEGRAELDMNDEIIQGSCVAHGGKFVNQRVAAALNAA